MGDRGASDTALAVAALRAAHRLHDAPPWLLDDPVAGRLLDPEMLEAMRANPAPFADPRARALRAHVLLRSRYAEDRLADAVQRGVRQCVVLGAGYDTFAYRQPAWAAPLRIFEVDHPASQRAKRDRLAAGTVAVPGNVEFVAVDFETETLGEGLLRSRFDPSQPAFLSWLGVMVYLRAEAVQAVFRFAASLPRGSEIVFTFSPPDAGVPSAAAARAAAAGEPWQSRLTRAEVVALLHDAGFTEIAFLAPDEAAARYFAGRGDGLEAPRGIRIGCAVVA